MSQAYVAPFGARYSQVHLQRGDPVPDSVRLRRRVSAFVKNQLSDHGAVCWQALEQRLGATSSQGHYHYKVEDFVLNSNFIDFADSISVLYDALREEFRKQRYSSIERIANDWLKFCQGAFTEENVAYDIDGAGLVRPKVDVEFQNSVSSTIAGLSDPRHAAVRHAVDSAISKISNLRPDRKGALRDVFEAFEILLKVEFGNKVPRLNKNVIIQVLKPVMLDGLTDETEKKAVECLCGGIVNWVDACHFYRHGQEAHEPTDPSLLTIVLIVSQGLSFIRWVVSQLSCAETEVNT